MITFVFVKKVTILGHAGRWIHGNGARELLVLRFAVTNSIIDPWIYILLRKETFIAMKRHSRGLCKTLFDRLDIPTESGIPESTPNEVSGCGKSKTISTDDQISSTVLHKL